MGEGNRSLETTDLGLCRLLLNEELDLISNIRNLTDSSHTGRIVIVSTVKSGSQDYFNEELIKLQGLRDAEIAKIEDKFSEEAEKVFRG